MDAAMQKDRSSTTAGRGWQSLPLHAGAESDHDSTVATTAHNERGDAGVVMTPITHVAAGWQVALSPSAERKLGTGDNAIDPDFVSLADVYASWAGRGTELGWISPDDVQAMLALPTGTTSQKSYADRLLNQCLSQVESQFASLVSPVQRELDQTFETDLEEWGYIFESEAEIEDESWMGWAEQAPYLIAEAMGVHCLAIDIAEVGQGAAVQDALFQLLSFCAELSQHALSTDLLLDERTQFMTCGELSDFIDTKDPQKMTSLSDPDSLDAYMTEQSGEDWREELCMDEETLCEYFMGVSIAVELSKGTRPLSKQAVSDFIDAIGGREDIPQPIIDAAQLLYTHCDWSAWETRAVETAGDTELAALRPVALYLPGEDAVFGSIHEMSMQASEFGLMGIELNDTTPAQLFNIHLGESLLVGLFHAFDGE